MELSPSLISLTVSVDVKHYVLLLLIPSGEAFNLFHALACADKKELISNGTRQNKVCTFLAQMLSTRQRTNG